MESLNDILTSNDPVFLSLPQLVKKSLTSNNNDFALLFVNPKSGSQQGKTVLELASSYILKPPSLPNSVNYKVITFPLIIPNKPIIDIKELNPEKLKNLKYFTEFDEKKKYSIMIFNIIDKEEYTKGKTFIKKFFLNSQKDKKIKIFVGGGDGTILSIVQDFNKDGIDLSRCVFGLIPFGTGNDLANSLGFGNKCFIDSPKSFNQVLQGYLNGKESKIDIWDIDVSVDENKGIIYDVVKGGQKIKTEADNENIKIKQFKRTFVNYFSVGFDAKVGFSFEQNRSSNRDMNKLIYGLEGVKCIFESIKDKYGLRNILDSLEEGEEGQKKIVFTTNGNNNNKEAVLKGNPVNIICQNINYYMGGTEGIWKKSGKVSVEGDKEKMETFDKQAFNDKKIEFFSFDKGIEIGLEKIQNLLGCAKKVYQGNGPFCLEFKKNPNEEDKKAMENVFFNVDGEFFHLVYPKRIMVRMNSDICQGQINIITNAIGD